MCIGEGKVGKLEVGLVLGLTSVLICVLVVGYAPFSPFSPFAGFWEEFDIHEEIGKLRTNDNASYSVYEEDWVEWSRQRSAVGGEFTKVKSWEAFQKSLEGRNIPFLMLDEEERVLWYNPSLTNQVVYFEY